MYRFLKQHKKSRLQFCFRDKNSIQKRGKEFASKYQIVTVFLGEKVNKNAQKYTTV